MRKSKDGVMAEFWREESLFDVYDIILVNKPG
jgi:hypothetical protein